MKPSARRAYTLLLDGGWHSGNELFRVAGTRYGARLDELKHELGIDWEKRWIRGSAVPLYRLVQPEPEQQTLRLEVAS